MNGLLKHLIVLASMGLAACTVSAQPPGTPQSAREVAPIDFTGYWVSLVTEDWRFRMLTAPAGDYEGIGLTARGREIANAWDPQADIAAGDACKAYGAGGIMRIPTRLHITWDGDNELQVDTDAGRQTRRLKFGPAQDNVGAGTLQGVTRASWQLERAGRGAPATWGSIQAETTEMSPGYLRRNGVPYGSGAQLTEYYELLVGGDGTEYLTVISILEDPEHLTQLYTTSANFKREPNGSNWNPSDCLAQ